MRLAIVLSTAAVTVGISGAYYFAAGSARSALPIPKFEKLISQKPDIAQRYVIRAIDVCLGDKARQSWTSKEVKDFSAAFYITSFSLMSQEISDGQRNQQLREWIIKAAGGLTREQKAAFKAIMRDGLNDRGTHFCVASTVNGFLGS